MSAREIDRHTDTLIAILRTPSEGEVNDSVKALKTTVICKPGKHLHIAPHHTTTILWPFFWDHPGEPVPEGNFWTL